MRDIYFIQRSFSPLGISFNYIKGVTDFYTYTYDTIYWSHAALTKTLYIV